MTPSALWPARLHHLRRDSTAPERLARFYGELLGDRVEALPGARESDRVLEGERIAAVFLRSDPEQHSFATFEATESRPDQHA